MRQGYARWVGVGLVLVLLVTAGCTRSKSSGPPELTPEETVSPAPTQTVGDEGPTAPTLSGDEAINATASAMAATATAESETPEDTEPAATTETPEPTTPTATEEPTATETAQPAQQPTPTSTPVPSSGRPTTHVVQQGENLFRIALQYGLTYQRLAAYNGIANPNIIQAGRELNIPPEGGTDDGTTPPPSEGGVHVVQQGENLFRIALQYDMLYTQLAAANGLSYPYTIYPGQRLTIP